MRLVTFFALMAMMLASAAVADTIEPLAMNNSAIGGTALNQYTPGVEGGMGTHNIALLIKTWGKVTFVDAVNKYFYIDDGLGRLDESGHVGVRVSYDSLAPGNTITPPSVDSFVLVTGISSTVVINTKVQPNVRPRRQDDVLTVSP